MIRDIIRIAFLNLSHRRLRSWLTMIGIFIGIAAVVSLIGLGQGLSDAIKSQFGFLGTDTLSVQASGINYGPPGVGAITRLSDTLVDKIKRITGIETAYNSYVMTEKLTFNDKQQTTYIVSMPPGKDRKIVETTNNLQLVDGRMLRDGDTKSVVLGNDFYTTDFFGKQIRAGSIVTIKGVKFTVVGILAKKGSFTTDRAVRMNENEVLDLYGNDHTTDQIVIHVKDPSQMNSVKADVEKLMRKERHVKVGEEDFVVSSPQTILDTLNSALFAVQLFVYIIAGISIVVGGIGIMNTLFTAVLERTREIGIMKAIGARNSTIFTLFAMESGFLGLVGGIIGIILGMGLAYGLAYLGRLALGGLIQASISPALIIGALTGSFLLGTLFGVLPAIQASRVQPVEALRK